MLNKTEKYLRTNYPIIWNLKMVLPGFIALVLYLLFFLLGYLITNPVARGDYESDHTGIYIFLFGCAILTAILTFLFWLIQYNKHNGLKAFYPQSTLSRYTEWLLTFILCIFIGFIPFSLMKGREWKYKTAVSEHEYREAKKIIARIMPLLPSNEYNFKLEGNTTPVRVGNANVDRTKFDTGLFTYEEDAVTPDNPIEYIGPSLLYFNNYYVYSSDDSDKAEMDKVHQWLVEEKEDSIRAAIQSFMNLQEKHKLKSNINTDTWMSIIYNPPLYPVDKNNLISKDSNESGWNVNRYTDMWALDNFYSKYNDIYDPGEFSNWYILITIISAMGISVMIFSARVTSGRSWVFALLSLGVLFFIYPLFIGFIALIGDSSGLFGILSPIFWICILVAIGVKIASKINSGDTKGKSKIYFNLFIWFIPAFIPWLYFIYMFITDHRSSDVDSEQLTYIMFVVNIVYTVIIMYPVCLLAKKWKALPED